MRFPRTHIDAATLRMKSFSEIELEGVATLTGEKGLVSTGTTIIGLVSPDKKIGIIASDGRVTVDTNIMKEDFPKVFDTRIGFIGAAGMAGVIQIVLPAFRLDLNDMCDARGEIMTAAGAVRRLYSFYWDVIRKFPNGAGLLGLVPLFWDYEEEKCHMYTILGASRMDCDQYASIGSGSAAIRGIFDKFQPADTEAELVAQARNLIKIASRGDGATNANMFYGIVNHGNFSMHEEVEV